MMSLFILIPLIVVGYFVIGVTVGTAALYISNKIFPEDYLSNMNSSAAVGAIWVISVPVAIVFAPIAIIIVLVELIATRNQCDR